MKNDKSYRIILTNSQWVGIIIVLLLLALIFVGLHFLPSPPPPEPAIDSVKVTITNNKQHYYDSLRRIRTARYDSIRLARRDSLFQVYTAHRDSLNQVDSLFWDSVKQSTPHPIKKDTILSLNAADTNDLKLIHGIGSGMARRIVRYREQLGGYSSVNQLLDDQLYQDKYGHSIRSRYCLSDSIFICFTIETDSIKPIFVNHASMERLQAHPYISHTLAKEIYTLRRKKLTLNNIDDIRDLPHMNDSLLQDLTPYLSFEK